MNVYNLLLSENIGICFPAASFVQRKTIDRLHETWEWFPIRKKAKLV